MLGAGVLAVIKNILIPGLLGGAIAAAGFNVATWQFWLLFLMAALWRYWPESK